MNALESRLTRHIKMMFDKTLNSRPDSVVIKMEIEVTKEELEHDEIGRAILWLKDEMEMRQKNY